MLLYPRILLTLVVLYLFASISLNAETPAETPEPLPEIPSSEEEDEVMQAMIDQYFLNDINRWQYNVDRARGLVTRAENRILRGTELEKTPDRPSGLGGAPMDNSTIRDRGRRLREEAEADKELAQNMLDYLARLDTAYRAIKQRFPQESSWQSTDGRELTAIFITRTPTALVFFRNDTESFFQANQSFFNEASLERADREAARRKEILERELAAQEESE